MTQAATPMPSPPVRQLMTRVEGLFAEHRMAKMKEKGLLEFEMLGLVVEHRPDPVPRISVDIAMVALTAMIKAAFPEHQTQRLVWKRFPMVDEMWEGMGMRLRVDIKTEPLSPETAESSIAA